MTGWYMFHHMSSVPFYIYVPVVLLITASHAWTFYWMKRRITDLEGALEMRAILTNKPEITLGNVPTMHAMDMGPNDTITFKRQDGRQILSIDNSSATRLTVSFQ